MHDSQPKNFVKAQKSFLVQKNLRVNTFCITLGKTKIAQNCTSSPKIMFSIGQQHGEVVQKITPCIGNASLGESEASPGKAVGKYQRTINVVDLVEFFTKDLSVANRRWQCHLAFRGRVGSGFPQLKQRNANK